MSGSEWGSWCSSCKRNAGLDTGGSRYIWWVERFREMKSDGLAKRPDYGPEPCFDCGREEMTTSYIFHPSVHAELIGEATATGGNVDQEVCSECWYEQNTAPPERRIDKQTSCDVCGKELVQVIVMTNHEERDEDEDEEDEPVEISVDMRRHVCTSEYATVYIEVPPAWADDPGYWDDEILEQALSEGYGPDWELDTDTESDDPAEIVEVGVV